MTQADVTDLKPCPFCGNDVTVPIEGALHLISAELEWRDETWTVQCDKCTATMGYSKTKEEAIDAWNTRATPVVKQSLTADVAEVDFDAATLGAIYNHNMLMEAKATAYEVGRVAGLEEAAKVADTEARAMNVLCADASDLDVMDRYGARSRTAARIADNIRALMEKEPK